MDMEILSNKNIAACSKISNLINKLMLCSFQCVLGTYALKMKWRNYAISIRLCDNLNKLSKHGLIRCSRRWFSGRKEEEIWRRERR